MDQKKLLFRLEKVTKTYKTLEKEGKYALNIEELDLYYGETTAVLGQSGHGKSTFLNLLGLLDTGDTGDIYYWDRDNESRSYRSLRQRDRVDIRRRDFGFTFQSGNLLSHLICRMNIAIPLVLNAYSRSDQLRIAKDLLDRVDLLEGDYNREKSFPTQVSGGEYQRVAVVRALAHNPRVVFADEPTGNLDSDNSEKVMQILREWREEQHGALILVTHEQSLAERYAHRIIRLRDGRIDKDSRNPGGGFDRW